LSRAAQSELEQRLSELEDERIPQLRQESLETGDEATLAVLATAEREAVDLRQRLAAALPLEDVPHDLLVVELGDSITVQEEDSTDQERFTLVGELEARRNQDWISLESPLGSALQGRSAGDTVSVRAPGGPINYRVVSIERD
jgi:transcription elongation factor GreA